MRFEYFVDAQNGWRWRFISKNGRIIAVSSESYEDKESCLRSIEIVQKYAPDATIEYK